MTAPSSSLPAPVAMNTPQAPPASPPDDSLEWEDDEDEDEGWDTKESKDEEADDFNIE